MLSIKDYIQKIAVATFIGYCFWVFLLVSKTIVVNYPPVKGFMLSNGRLLGGDFIAFYTAGEMAGSDKSNLYDFRFQVQRRNQILGGSAENFKVFLPFVYPPLMAWGLSGLTAFDFPTAFYLFTFLSALIAVASLLLLLHFLRPLDILSVFVLVVGVFGFMPFYNGCLLGGQLASIGIFIYSLVFILIVKKKDFLAGLALSLGYYKPPLFVLFAVALILTRGRQFRLGCLCGGLMFTVLTILYMGPYPFYEYITIARKYTYGQELVKGLQLPLEYGMGVFALATTLAPSMTWALVVYIVLFLGALFISVTCLKKSDSDSDLYHLAYAFTVISSLAFSLQLIKYDLSILLVPFLIVILNRSFIGPYKLAMIVSMALFYLEWPFRKMVICEYVINLAPFLFLLSLAVFLISFRVNAQNTEPAAVFEKKVNRKYDRRHNA